MTRLNAWGATSLAFVAVVFAATGCTSTNAGEGVSPAPSSAPPAVVVAAPAELVGTWRVAAADEPPTTAVQFGSDITLLRDCGVFKGNWRATAEGAIAARLYQRSESCGGPPANVVGVADAVTPVWMTSAASLGREAGGLVLLDRSGVVTARLTRVAAEEADGATTLLGADPAPESGAPNVITLPAPPAGLAVPVVETLAGSWRPPDPRAISRVRLDAEGRESTFDGCNGGSGFVYRVPLGTGVVLMPAGIISSSLRFCSSGAEEGATGDWMWTTADGTLVYTDAEGRETGRFVRNTVTPSPAP
jgi:hypothetical protein